MRDPRRRLTLIPSSKLASRPDVPGPLAPYLDLSDQDIAAGNFESALDQTLLAMAVYPGWLPLLLRHVELLLTTERYDPALQIVRTIESLVPSINATEYALELERMRTHAFPTPDSLLKLATTVLDAGRADLAECYVPAALEIAFPSGGSEIALKLAKSWSASQPQSWPARMMLAVELAAAGRFDEAKALLSSPPHAAADRSLVAALGVAALCDATEQWIIAARLWEHVRQNRRGIREVRVELAIVNGKLGNPAALKIHEGLIELASGNSRVAQQLLLTTRPPDMVRAYAALAGAFSAAMLTHDQETAVAALERAAQLHARPEIADFAGRVPVFPGGRGLLDLGTDFADRIAAHGEVEQAAEVLEVLTKAAPKDAGLAKRYAELLDKSGHQDRAISRLRALLARQEQIGDGEGVQQTLRSMLQISPDDEALRERLIRECMQRGNLAGVAEERCRFAERLSKNGKTAEALDQLLQALEVASLASEWHTLEMIFNHIQKVAPNDIDLRHRAITAAIEHGKITEAVRHLWDVAKISGDKQDVDESIAALHQIIALAPSDSDAYHRLGEALASIGEFQQAERVYRRLQLLLPDDPGVRAKQAALAALARESA